MTGIDQLKQALNQIAPLLKKGSINESTANFLRNNLDKIIPFFISPVFGGLFLPDIFRVTINKTLPKNNNKRVKEIGFLKYPPPDSIKKHGRANDIKQSVLYAAFDPITVLSELKPQIGDLITITTWGQKENNPLTVSPIFKRTTGNNISHNKMSMDFLIRYQNMFVKLKEPEDKKMQMNLLVEFISDCFAKEVSLNDSYDYYLSVYFSNKIFYEFYDGNVDAIIYPSVANELSFSNIALKTNVFDEKFLLKEIEESVLMSVPIPNNMNSGYFLKGKGYAINFDEKSGLIFWKDR